MDAISIVTMHCKHHCLHSHANRISKGLRHRRGVWWERRTWFPTGIQHHGCQPKNTEATGAPPKASWREMQQTVQRHLPYIHSHRWHVSACAGFRPWHSPPKQRLWNSQSRSSARQSKQSRRRKTNDRWPEGQLTTLDRWPEGQVVWNKHEEVYFVQPGHDKYTRSCSKSVSRLWVLPSFFYIACIAVLFYFLFAAWGIGIVTTASKVCFVANACCCTSPSAPPKIGVFFQDVLIIKPSFPFWSLHTATDIDDDNRVYSVRDFT